MFTRRLPYFASICLLALPLAIRAEDKAGSPIVVFRLQSIEGLLDNAKYLGEAIGKGEEAKQFLGAASAFIGDKGLEGVDTKRPIGAYTVVSEELTDPAGVFLLPIADEKAVLDLLERFSVKAVKAKNGVYTINDLPNVPLQAIYLRFHEKYAYITNSDKAVLDPKKLLSPTKVLAGDAKGIFSLNVHVDRIPDQVKQIGLAFLDGKLAEEKAKKQDGETPAQTAAREKGIDAAFAFFKSVVNDGGNAKFRVDIDRNANQLVVELSLSGKEKSKLAMSIADIGKAQSLFARLMTPDAAVNGGAFLAVPEDVKKAFDAVVDEGLKKSLQNEKDAHKRELAEKVLKTLMPTIKAGTLDFGVSMRKSAKGDLYTIIGGVKIKDGEAVNGLVKDLLREVPVKDAEKVKLNAESAGALKIHRVDAQDQFEPQAKKLFGSNPVYFAFGPSSFLVAAGPEALSALKACADLNPQPLPPVHVEVHLARLAAAMAADNKAAPKIAKEAFSTKGSDTVTFTVEGGSSLKARLSLSSAVLKFFVMLEEAKKEG